ncbi:ADCY10 [Symbiodinium sp. CCMP2592]|nr:ADCY10 [Symbiodinium sp. CCMP2592]
MSEEGPKIAQELMESVQRACYQHEGTLNKFLIDDKGMLFLLVFGLPPLVHTDDPTRAVLACFDMVKVFKRLKLCGKFGVTTGRSYCGVCGSARRMEYTVLGDCVNLSARLMSNAPANGILCDDITRKRSTTEVIFNALAPIKVKGKAANIPVFQPVKKEYSSDIGLNKTGKISFPWHQNAFGGTTSGGLSVAEFQEGVIRLCSIKSWQGISKASELLGSGFRREIHNDQPVDIPTEPNPAAKPPPKSPFSEGGVVVIEGATGTGKIETAEHIDLASAMYFV